MKTLFVLPFIVVSLLFAIWGGWLRIGWSLPAPALAAQHGALMVNSFLASLIFLERAVTFKNRWIIVLPLINAASGIGFLTHHNFAALLLLTTGSLGFVVMCGYFVSKYKELYYYVFLAGSVALFTGNMLLLKSGSYPVAVNWWIVFFVFTIVAERLELSRFLALTPFAKNSILLALFFLFLTLFFPFHSWGNAFFALALCAIAVWLLRYDMAFRSLHISGQHRYSALLLITGYVWLLITAMLVFWSNNIALSYDAVLHAFFIGFVFSMIFSHAPIILPAVLKLPIKLYRPVLYVWFVLLQASLLLRVGAGVAGNIMIRKSAGMANGVAILLFFATVAVIVRTELKRMRFLIKA